MTLCGKQTQATSSASPTHQGYFLASVGTWSQNVIAEQH